MKQLKKARFIKLISLKRLLWVPLSISLFFLLENNAIAQCPPNTGFNLLQQPIDSLDKKLDINSPNAQFFPENNCTPIVNDVRGCYNERATLKATACAGGIITWWTTSTGGTQVCSGTFFTTDTLKVTTIYYAQCQSDTCFSPRVPVTVTVEKLIAPVVPNENIRICSGQPAILTATGCTNGSLKWCNCISGGTEIGRGSPFATNPLTENTTFYVQCEIGTCVSPRTYVHVKIDSPIAPIATNVQICAGQTATLTATGCSDGLLKWCSCVSGGTQTGTGSTLVTVPLDSTSLYAVECQIGACTSAQTYVTIDVIPISAPKANSVQICSGQTAKLTATTSAGNRLSWWTSVSGGTKIGTDSIFNTPVLTNTTTYYVESQSTACVSKRIPVIVTVNNKPIATTSGEDTINCKKTEVVLRGTTNAPNTNYEWKTPSGRISSGISIATKEAGTHTFTAIHSTSGCKASNTVLIKLDTEYPIISDVRVIAPQCAQSSDGKIIVTATASSGIIPLSYKLNNGILNTQNTFSALNAGNYTLTVEGKNFCSVSKNLIITAPPQFTEKIIAPLCYYSIGTEVQLQLQENTATAPIRYVWSAPPSVSFSCINCASPKIIIRNNTPFQVKVIATDSKGCIATDGFLFDKIQENKPPDIITPNGDGLNDALVFSDLDCGASPEQFLNNEITIVNRWGDVVFKMKNYNNTWDGTNQKGQPLPEGTYYYVLRLSLGEGKIYRNNVLIVR
jgi:gliding motility-associated-like protein